MWNWNPKPTPWFSPFLQMLSRNKIYSLAGIQYNEAKFQLEKQIFVPKQLNTPKTHQMMLLSNFRNGISEKIMFCDTSLSQIGFSG